MPSSSHSQVWEFYVEEPSIKKDVHRILDTQSVSLTRSASWKYLFSSYGFLGIVITAIYSFNLPLELVFLAGTVTVVFHIFLNRQLEYRRQVVNRPPNYFGNLIDEILRGQFEEVADLEKEERKTRTDVFFIKQRRLHRLVEALLEDHRFADATNRTRIRVLDKICPEDVQLAVYRLAR